MASVSQRLSVTEYCKQRLRFGEKDDTDRSERVGDVSLIFHVERWRGTVESCLRAADKVG